MGFASPTNPYPCNATFAFDEHNRTSLIHSPDPQVAPGWQRFGWGHGDPSTGVPEPADATGLHAEQSAPEELVLEVELPETIFRGEFVTARFVLTNIGGSARWVTTALNLSQGDLRLLISAPGEDPVDARDVVIACGDRTFTRLEPGEQMEGVAQIFYTTLGRTFRQTGRYYVSGELHVGDPLGCTVRSEPREIVVRAPANEAEQAISRITMDEQVARSFALGDFGLERAVREKLEALAERHADTDTGTAAALVLANSLARPLRNLRSRDEARAVLRPEEPDSVNRALEQAAHGYDAERLVTLAAAVVAPTEPGAPVLDRVWEHVRKQFGEDPAGDAGAAGRAEALLNAYRRTLVQ